MELRMERVAAAVRQLDEAVDLFCRLRADIRQLEEYYHQGLWLHDFADDEAGLLPKDMLRGVLSEDGLWNLLDKCSEIETMIKPHPGDDT